jgi:alpha-ketoglutarate-dependent taurine dioxygenase
MVKIQSCSKPLLSSLNWTGEAMLKSDKWLFETPTNFILNDQCTDDLINIVGGKLRQFGVVLLRGLPIHPQDEDGARQLLMKLGKSLGCPLSQSNKLDFIGSVTDKGSQYKNPTQRGYEGAANLPFHTDRCDIIALLCVRQALNGGHTRVVSSVKAFELLSQQFPQYAQLLMEPVPFDKRDDENGTGWTCLPVFSMENGNFVSRYVRRFIESSQRFLDAPRLTDLHFKAFDALDNIFEEPGMSLDFVLRTGDLLFIDNHRTYHSRSAFFDPVKDNIHNRLLLRLWLAWEGSPVLPSGYLDTYVRGEAGCYRGGVWPKDTPLHTFPTDLSVAQNAIQSLLSLDVTS